MAKQSIHTLVNLSSLPKPQVVETPQAEDILAELKALFLALEPNYELIHEDDPVMKLLELFAYRELILRERINEAARATLLSFSSAHDLEHLGSFYDVARLVGETDADFRYRIQLKAMGWVGNHAYYKFWTLSADVRVYDAAVYSPNHNNSYNMGGRVYIAVMSKENNSIPSPQLMDAVRDVVLSDQVRVLTDIVTVEPAVARVANISARITLLPSSTYDVFLSLEPLLRKRWAEESGLGWDITTSWLMDVLHEPGVHDVQIISPTMRVTRIPPNEFPVLGNVQLSFGGFSDYEGAAVDDMEHRRLERLMYDFYLQYAVQNLRTQEQIMDDLAEKDRPGVLQPTVRGLANYLRITNIKNDDGTFIAEDEICFLIRRALEPMYQAGTVIPTAS